MQALNVESTVAQPTGLRSTSTPDVRPPASTPTEVAAPSVPPPEVPRSRPTSVSDAPPQAMPNVEDREQFLREMTDELQALTHHSVQVQYSDEDSRFIVKILDAESREVIRQFPSEQLLEASKHLKELRGLLFDDRS